MKKTILSFLLGMLLLAGLTLSVSAERTLPLVVDGGGLLDEVEYSLLLEELEEISENQRCEVAVVTVNSLEGNSVVSYADDFFDYNGYGYGENDDGVMLLVAMNEREFHITTHGFAVYGLTDYGLALIEDMFIDDLSKGNYYNAFTLFARMCDEYLTLAREGTPVDVGYDEGFSVGFALFVSVIVGLIGGFIGVSSLKSSMTTVRMQTDAQNYVRANSLTLTAQSDRFLYKQVQRIPRSDGNSSGGGGSTTHRSSSGRSHGGRSGRF